MIIVREFTFDSAHKLEWYDGNCRDLHGHTYKLQVSLKGKLDKNGIVIDFRELDRIVKEKVMKLVDHKYLNDIINNPTAENISKWIWSKLVKELKGLFEVRLWETPKSQVIYRGD